MQISQIFITENDSALPPLLAEAAETVKSNLPATSYILYTNSMILDLIRSYFDDQVLAAYLRLVPYSFKADLAKYLILKIFGGWYVDTSIKIVRSLNPIPDQFDLLYFRDIGNGLTPYTLTYNIQASFLFARPNNSIFDEAIRLVVRHCTDEYYGLTPVCPTGPGVLGRAIASFGNQPSHLIGQFLPLTPLHSQKNRSYVFPNGDIVALHKDAWFPDAVAGDISRLGVNDGNNYIDLYKSHSIYRSQVFKF